MQNESFSKLSPSQESTSGLEVGILENIAISVGRRLIELGQGVKLRCLQTGAKLGVSNTASVHAYTRKINAEALLFSATPAANSFVGMATEAVVDGCIGSVKVPMSKKVAPY